MKWSALSYSILMKTLQVIAIAIFFILVLFMCAKVIGHVDLVDIRTIEMDQMQRDAHNRAGREAYDKDQAGTASESEIQQSHDWQQENMS